MDKKCQTLTFNVKDYINEEEMFKAVAEIIRLLVKNRYECAFHYEDCNIYILEFNYDRTKRLGTPYIYWLNTEEEDILYIAKEENNNE